MVVDDYLLKTSQVQLIQENSVLVHVARDSMRLQL